MAKTDERSPGQALSEAYRLATGLPVRKNDKPADPLNPSELTTVELEGGLGGEGDKGLSGLDTPDGVGLTEENVPRVKEESKPAAKKAAAKKTAAKKA